MNSHSTLIYLLIAVVVTNLIRVLPVTVFKKKITNRFFRSFLYYVPYVTLAAMTVPAIMQATASPISGGAALIAGILAAWAGLSLFSVSMVSCLTVFILELFITVG